MASRSSQALLFGDEAPVDYAPELYPTRRVMLASGSEHWCTHPDQIAVVEKFAPIAFDPFSNPYSLVKAEQAVMLPQNSLLMEWPREGLTFINPPYGDALEACAEKIGQEADKGNESITLVPARVDTAWWQILLRPVLWCAWKGRLKFLETLEALLARHAERVERARKGNRKPPELPRYKHVSEALVESESAPFAVGFCYHGKRLQRFTDVFGQHGKIYAEVSR